MNRARDALHGDKKTRLRLHNLLIDRIIGKNSHITKLAERYFSLRDMLRIASLEIGTGRIGGKSVGMLLGRKILETDAWAAIRDFWAPHDSFYLGADIFSVYIAQNGWQDLHARQKTPEGYYARAPNLQEKLLTGNFPILLRKQFMRIQEHYGRSPIIVRSSSLLEDNAGNAFAGKYGSVFCVNQGSPKERREAFERAVRTIYASSLSREALAYRQRRGLADQDERMAILVQRVSGGQCGELFFPHVAGVGNSFTRYAWSADMDPRTGMLRLVFGLGGRAVNRVDDDYAKILSLDRPELSPPVAYGNEKKFSQHRADVLDLKKNRLTAVSLEELSNRDLHADNSFFFSVDDAALARMKEHGDRAIPTPHILDFRKLLTGTAFPKRARTVLATLEAAYACPVSIEFTTHFNRNGDFGFNLLQCRPLQAKPFDSAVEMPKSEEKDVFFSVTGNFMGGNSRLALDYVIFVKTKEYLELIEREQYQIARMVGALNRKLKGNSVLLIGPGRWGTTMSSLGVPVHFSEVCNMAALCEVSCRQAGLMPEFSFGSHFFQDIVESDMLYAAIFEGDAGVSFNPDRILDTENLFGAVLPHNTAAERTIHLARTAGLTLYSDIAGQRLLCC
jgi:hypothetical protein